MTYEKSELIEENSFGENDVDNAWLRRRQIKAYFDLLPASVIGNLLNAILVASLYFQFFSAAGFVVAVAIAIGLAAMRLITWQRYRTRGTTQKQRGRCQGEAQHCGAVA